MKSDLSPLEASIEEYKDAAVKHALVRQIRLISDLLHKEIEKYKNDVDWQSAMEIENPTDPAQNIKKGHVLGMIRANLVVLENSDSLTSGK